MKYLQTVTLRRWLLSVVALGTLQLTVNPAGGAVFEQGPTARWALIVHDGSPEQLTRILREAYGFDAEQIFELYGSDATLERIQDAMNKLYERIRQNDVLLVHLSLPIVREPERLSLKPFDGKHEAPWTLLDIRRVVSWLNVMPTGTVLLTYLSCKQSEKELLKRYVFDDLSFGKRGGVLEIMWICDWGSQRNLADAQVQDFSRRGDLLRTMNMVLSELSRSSHRLQPVSTEEFAARIETELKLHGFQLSIDRFPEYAEQGFAFVLTPTDISSYQAGYENAPDRTLKLLVSEAVKGRGGFQPAAIDFLKKIAMEPNGLLQAPGSIDTRLLRWQAIEGLGVLSTYAAKDALVYVMVNAEEPSVRRRAVTEISRLQEPRPQDREAVRQALEDPDATVQEAAARAAVTLRDVDALPLLATLAAEDPDQRVRVSALQGISVLGGEAHRALFTASLQDSDPGVRREAAVVLGRLGINADATRILLQILENEKDDAVREAAAYAIADTATTEDRDSTVNRLIAAAERSTDRARQAATFCLGKIGGKKAESFLRNQLANKRMSEAVRITAAEALGQLVSQMAMKALEKAARSPSAGLRRAAVSAIGAIGGKDAAEILVSKLKDEDPYVRAAAQEAVDMLEPPPTKVLQTSLSDSSPEVRLEAVRRLGAAREAVNVNALVERLGDPDTNVQQATIDALAGYDHAQIAEAIDGALNHENPRVRQGAVIVLGHSVTQEAPAGLLKATRDPDGSVRAEAVRSLGKYENAQVRDLVLTSTRDDDPAVRRGAIEALERDSGEPGEQRLRELALRDPSSEVRESAIRALGSGSSGGSW